METLIENKIVDTYFRYFKNWDTELKKDLIVKLTKSIDSDSMFNRDFSECFGAWDDERTAEEIADEIRNDRVNNRDIEEF